MLEAPNKTKMLGAQMLGTPAKSVLTKNDSRPHRPHQDKLFDNGHFGARKADAFFLVGAIKQHFAKMARALALLTESR
jgi:hypothetical protein